MNDFLKIGLIGAGVYLLYEAYKSYNIAAVATPGTTGNTGATNANTSNTITEPAALQYPLVTSAQLYGAADPGVTTLNQDQWSYYYNKLTGYHITPRMMEDAFGTSGSQELTADEWLARMVAIHGMSGLGMLSRMTGERASGWERAIRFPNLA